MTNHLTEASHRFETLGEAERALVAQGFKLVPDTCDWIDEARQIDAGVYAVEGDYGTSTYRIEYRTLTDTRRREIENRLPLTVGVPPAFAIASAKV